MLAGFLRGEPVELVKCKTNDLHVPANAEIVLEGYVEQGELTLEGPFGDHTGYYTAGGAVPGLPRHRDDDAPRRDLSVDRRRQAAAEDAWLGKATERIFLPAIRMTRAGDRRLRPAVAGAFHNCVHRLDPQGFPGQPQKVMHAIWGLGMLSLTKCVVVVDEHVDVHDYEEVFFYVGANVDPKRDVMLSEGPLDHLDHAPTRQFYGGKMGIDATHKGPEEGTREWPEEIEMSEEIRALVDRRWDEYGIGVDSEETNGHGKRPLRQLLRR